jgi:hypothetical protein
MYVITQSYTLNTSSRTSRMQAGRTSGSKLLNRLSVANMSTHMHNKRILRVKRLETRMWSALYMIDLSHNTNFDFIPQESTSNIFNNIPALAKPRLLRLRDKLAAYLSTDPEYVEDVLTWWYKK